MEAETHAGSSYVLGYAIDEQNRLLRQAAFLQGDDNGSLRLDQRRDGYVGEMFAMTGRRQIDMTFADGRAALDGLPHKLQYRTAERDQIPERLLEQRSGAGLEELFGGRVDENQLKLWADHDYRHW